MIGSFIHHFPTPEFLTMPSCAFDISDESIKYGQIERNGANLKLKYFGSVAIEPGVIVAGKIENEAKLAEVLRPIKEKLGIKFVRVCLPEEQMYLFNLVLPKVPYKEMRETIALQLEDHIPISGSDAVFDHEVVRESDEENVLVQVVATTASLVDSYLSVFSELGLVPLSFELEAQSIARAIIPSTTKNGAVMIVDFGKTRSGISIAQDGRVFFTSTFGLGGQKITEVIAKHFKIELADAEALKHSYSSLGSDSENDIFPAIVANLSILLDELKKHQSYWNTHNFEDGKPHEKISKVLLCGGEANLYGVASYLRSSLGIDVDCANVWVNIADVAKDLPSMDFDESLTYATVFGIALGDFEVN